MYMSSVTDKSGEKINLLCFMLMLIFYSYALNINIIKVRSMLGNS